MSAISQESIELKKKFDQAWDAFNVHRNFLEQLTKLYQVKLRTKTSDEPKEFFDELDAIFQRTLADFNRTKKIAFEARDKYYSSIE